MSIENASQPFDPLSSGGDGGVAELRDERGGGAVTENESQQIVMCDCMS